ncbi:hypothetical protein ACFL6C_05400 [Myxococcota bacterium]
MAKTEKVAVTVDSAVLLKAERLRQKTGESRSAVVTRALRLLLADEEKWRQVAEYTAAYRDDPETDEDVETARALAKQTLKGLPW